MKSNDGWCLILSELSKFRKKNQWVPPFSPQSLQGDWEDLVTDGQRESLFTSSEPCWLCPWVFSLPKCKGYISIIYKICLYICLCKVSVVVGTLSTTCLGGQHWNLNLSSLSSPLCQPSPLHSSWRLLTEFSDSILSSLTHCLWYFQSGAWISLTLCTLLTPQFWPICIDICTGLLLTSVLFGTRKESWS